MKRDYITGNFDTDLELTINFLTDRKIKLEAREELATDFCSIYVNFDSSKLDRYLYK